SSVWIRCSNPRRSASATPTSGISVSPASGPATQSRRAERPRGLTVGRLRGAGRGRSEWRGPGQWRPGPQAIHSELIRHDLGANRICTHSGRRPEPGAGRCCECSDSDHSLRAGSVLHARPSRTEILAGLDDAFSHALLGGLSEGARVVELLVADLAVDLEHSVVVAEHVLDDRASERVLGVGVDVHLHHSVADSLGDLLRARARAAVEDEVERLVLADLSTDRGLDLPEQFGPEPDIAGLVDAVDVAEGQRGEVAALVAGAQRTRGGQTVGDGGVELVVDRVLHAVLFTS